MKCELSFFIIIFNWSIIDLQCHVSFRCTAKWFSFIYIIYIYTHTYILFFFLLFFWLRWVFVTAHGLSLVAASRGCSSLRASRCGGFSCCRARALGTRAPVVAAHGLSSCGLWALDHRLSSCGAWALLLHGMWDIPGPGLEPMSPALAGGFLTTAPPGKLQYTHISFFR